MTTVADLHKALFHYVPDKPGTAYERLTALVLAVLGWKDVQHDTRESGEGRDAKHQLDVTAREPSGEVERLIVECKDWNVEVGKGAMDTLVGVRAQLGADAAAVVTTVGFKAGARAVAKDERIAMLLLRPFDPENPINYVKRINLTIDCIGTRYSDLTVQMAPGEQLPADAQIQGRCACCGRTALPPRRSPSCSKRTPRQRLRRATTRTPCPSRMGAFCRSATAIPSRYTASRGRRRWSAT